MQITLSINLASSLGLCAQIIVIQVILSDDIHPQISKNVEYIAQSNYIFR